MWGQKGSERLNCFVLHNCRPIGNSSPCSAAQVVKRLLWVSLHPAWSSGGQWLCYVNRKLLRHNRAEETNRGGASGMGHCWWAYSPNSWCLLSGTYEEADIAADNRDVRRAKLAQATGLGIYFGWNWLGTFVLAKGWVFFTVVFNLVLVCFVFFSKITSRTICLSRLAKFRVSFVPNETFVTKSELSWKLKDEKWTFFNTKYNSLVESANFTWCPTLSYFKVALLDCCIIESYALRSFYNSEIHVRLCFKR